MVRKIKVVARRRKKTWVIHRRGKRIIAHARKMTWTYYRKDVGAPGKGRKVIKIKEKGTFNELAMKYYGKRYFDLNDKQRQRILRILAKKYSEKELLGKLIAQKVFRKRQRDHVKEKVEEDVEYVSKKLFPP